MKRLPSLLTRKFVFSAMVATIVRKMSDIKGDVSWGKANVDGHYYNIPLNIVPSKTVNTDSGRKHICSRCGKTYKAMTSLSRHVRE